MKRNHRMLTRLPGCFAALGLTLCLVQAVPAATAQGAADLNNLSLQQAVDLLRRGNHDLSLAGSAVEAATADLDVAGERPNPQLSLSTSHIDLHGNNGNGNLWNRPYDTVIGWSQPLERGGKRGLRRSVADANLNAAGQDRQAVFRDQLAALYDSYYDLLEAQDKVRISEEAAESYRRSVAAAEQRFKLGDIAAADVARLRVEASRGENDARQAQSDLAQARLTVARLLGQEAQAGQITAAGPWPDAAAEPADADLAALVEQQPEVKAAQARVEAARKAVELARSQQVHDLSLSLQYEHQPPDLKDSVGVGISMPIMIGSNFKGEIRRANADLTTAQLNLDNVRSQVRTALATEHDALATSANVVARFRGDVLRNAKRAADSAEYAYGRGASGLMDLLDARRTLYAVQQDALAAEAAYAQHQATWNSILRPEELQP